MRSLVLLLLLSTVLVSNVMADEEMLGQKIKALFKSYQNRVKKDVEDARLDAVEQNVDSPLGL